MRFQTTLRYIDAVARTGSIRKAAESLSITSTALNRRILAFEEELGADLFERMSTGVRLSAAGELLLQSARNQLGEMERLRAQIADLKGERRGHVAIACSQALLPYFFPEQISIYRAQHPRVTFKVIQRDRAAAEEALTDRSADLAAVFEPAQPGDFDMLLAVDQPIHAVMAADHPLAQAAQLRLRDCLQYPLVLPTGAISVRGLIEAAARRMSARMQVVVESDNFEFMRNLTLAEPVIAFQIPVGLPGTARSDGTVSRPVDRRDLAAGRVYLGHLRGRVLPVAVAGFARQVQQALAERYG
ncbi:LysR family transcriptional regulator [Mangrovicoccus algicola]|uniref:LysR family transcriptional regulator n=1 Tax=Mangrovicoccus algicola TaxID=2771008 RepID=A0A8J6YYD3_9RHOB|nr:LysR family transcriptional regulator [Mangrovicoccus algicola]MBE3640072.1 LysR family transcriptional regulator [Mangrovicoccus algicola]